MEPAADYSHLSKPTKVVRGNLDTWLRYTLHLIPLGLAAAILYINFARLYWFPLSGINSNGDIHVPANTIISVLQLAAKAYEILVVTSLGAIALTVFKRHLVQDSVPFGLLTGPYRISDPLYVASRSFWSSAPSNVKLAVLFLVCLVLCTLIGPASAILIVPKLGWFPVPDAFSNIYMPMYLSGSSDRAWPKTLNETLYENWTSCKQRQGSYSVYCPAGGFSHLHAWTGAWEASELSENITFEDPATKTSRRLHMVSGDSSEGSAGTVLTSVTALTTSAMGKLRAYFTANDVGIIHSTETYKLRLNSSSHTYQPLVNAKCNAWTHQQYNNVSEVPDLYYPSAELNCYSNDTDDDCHRMLDLVKDEKVPQDVWSQQQFGYRFRVVGDNSTSVLAFRGAMPYLNDGKKDMRVFACTYMAWWIPSTPILAPSEYRSIESNITDLSIFSNQTTFSQAQPSVSIGPAMRIQETWGPYIDLRKYKYTNDQDEDEGAIANVDTILRSLRQEQDGEWYFGPGSSLKQPDADRVARITMEKVTGAIVTDAIARTAVMVTQYIARPIEPGSESILAVNLGNQNALENKEYEFFANRTTYDYAKNDLKKYAGLKPEEALAKWGQNRVKMGFDVERFGYGYGRHSGAMIFAIGVNIAYMAFVVGYFLAMAYVRPDAIRGLGDLQDLTRLAWSSPPVPEIENQVIAVSDKRLWNKGVAIGATSSGVIEMELVDGERDSKLSRLTKDKEYY